MAERIRRGQLFTAAEVERGDVELEDVEPVAEPPDIDVRQEPWADDAMLAAQALAERVGRHRGK